ncbi:SEFIR domain-containing protein [Actinokineospora terrae]|uniref:NPCBM/NEW2 domain-containing protein n=1 Tax=Actinokineospora terrae TaxID=155974 RepID=A0A1H9LCS9_9PSEU|nr:SEFIR domain-containing protein [Actinokineospora terrae]SER09138.1 NPCBM/NEW2 domain-containing protein [Actinokineospora terrae]
MSESSAPRVFVTYSHDSEVHKRLVREFAGYLQGRIGLEVHLDQWADGPRRDWSLWAMDNLRDADFVLVIASPAYKRRAEGLAPPDEGRGAQFEAAILRDHLTKNLAAGTQRVLPVVLPGGSVEDIPMFLTPYSTTRYEIADFTEGEVAYLISAITGESAHTAPERAPWRGGVESTPGDRPRLLLAQRERWLDSSDDFATGTARIEGVPYENSLLLRPTTTPVEHSFVEFDLGVGSYRELTTTAGIVDDATERFQTGRIEVAVDGRLRLAETVSWGRPVRVRLDLAEARRLRLAMYRPAPAATPFGGGAAGLSGTPPELAWGDPMVR